MPDGQFQTRGRTLCRHLISTRLCAPLWQHSRRTQKDTPLQDALARICPDAMVQSHADVCTAVVTAPAVVTFWIVSVGLLTPALLAPGLLVPELLAPELLDPELIHF